MIKEHNVYLLSLKIIILYMTVGYKKLTTNRNPHLCSGKAWIQNADLVPETPTKSKYKATVSKRFLGTYTFSFF